MAKLKAQRNKRKSDKFKTKHGGITRTEWARIKKAAKKEKEKDAKQ